MGAQFNLRAVTIASTGTGTLTLGAAVAPFKALSAAPAVPTGAFLSYRIDHGSDWELSEGIYNSAAGTITRNLVESSTGSLINITGSATVALVPHARDFPPQSNMTAASAPTAANDQTQGYAVGSQWLWAARGLLWICLDATTGAAIWQLSSEVFPNFSGGRPSFSWDSRPAYEISGSNQLFGGRWSGTSGAGGSFTLATLAADGISMRRGTGGTSGFSRAQPPSQSAGYLKAEAGTRYEHEATILFPSAAAIAPDATNTWGFTCGFNGAVTANDTPGQNFALFHWRWNGTAAEFVARRRRANGSIISTALTAPPADGELRLRTVINGQTSVEFWVNGVLQATDTTNVPLSTAVLLEVVEVFHQAGTADRGVNLRRQSLRVSA
ncbi:hypothetical protein [Aquidulcibacter sp.]|uniref:hypothetical protein n=1 Tax=Aquidulcibacter sp. TaxID=2052990 RepID=UPI0025BB9107|nr:hypothetical protein [Aquidulcibacter sp.]MCA3696246.1 hypothetical protein [Aquidulcibacter sp.]